jgi:thiamine-monophosphate kinase
LGLPEDYAVDFVDGLYEGINKLASRQQVAIVGGETTASPGGVFISVAVLGLVTKARCALRSGAKAGDAIFVTGELGGSLLGKHLDFEPRLAEGRWLVETFQVHAMIDLSDGLAGDLRHVLEASQVGAELLSEAIPISRAARQPCRQRPAAEQEQNAPPPSGGATPKSPLLAALTDGEDFELLFTLSSGDAVPLVDAWKQRFPGTRLSCVGRVTSEPGVHIRDRQGPQPLNTDGYVHFAQRGRDR